MSKGRISIERFLPLRTFRNNRSKFLEFYRPVPSKKRHRAGRRVASRIPLGGNVLWPGSDDRAVRNQIWMGKGFFLGLNSKKTETEDRMDFQKYVSFYCFSSTRTS